MCTVADMLSHLLGAGFDITYEMAKDVWEAVERQARITDLQNSLPIPGGASVECRFVWDFRYDPEKVPAKLTDPDAIEPDDIMSALIVLPAPPPGWAFPELVPLLCPLGAGEGWGCPPRPTDPTGESQPIRRAVSREIGHEVAVEFPPRIGRTARSGLRFPPV